MRPITKPDNCEKCSLDFTQEENSDKYIARGMCKNCYWKTHRRRTLHSNCEKCSLDFTQEENSDKYIAKGMCKNCYWKTHYEENYKVKKVDLGFCSSCNVKWGDINKKGHVVKKVGTLCQNCYSIIYRKKDKICVVCLTPILNKTTRDVCKRCFVPVGDKRKKEKVTRISKVIKNNDYKPTSEDYETLKRLLVRYKLGICSPVDPYIVLDFYITLVIGEGKLSPYEAMESEDQITYMLKDLKEVYDLYKKQIGLNVNS